MDSGVGDSLHLRNVARADSLPFSSLPGQHLDSRFSRQSDTPASVARVRSIMSAERALTAFRPTNVGDDRRVGTTGGRPLWLAHWRTWRIACTPATARIAGAVPLRLLLSGNGAEPNHTDNWSGSMSPNMLAAIGVVATVFAALVAVVAFVWQVAVHRNSGLKIHVKSTYTMPYFEDSGFHDDDFVENAVTNKGGKPVTVTNYAVGLQGKRSGANMWITRPPAWATRLPATVQPGGAPAKLLVPVSELRKARKSRDLPFNKMVPWVELGDGRKVYSTDPVPLKD